MSKNKIAIVTFHRTDNYGAVLQNYALQQANMKLGLDVYTVDLRSDEIENPYKNKLFKRHGIGFIKGTYLIFMDFLNYKKTDRHIEAFNKFRKTNLCLTKEVDCLSEIEDEYDVFITGSDQVWNKKITREHSLDDFLLNNIQTKRKTSYAASCGHTSNLDDSIIKKISQLDYITVRENTLAEVLSKYIKSNIAVVCDPVFLLDKDEWVTRINGVSKRNEKYIFLYYNAEEAFKIAKYLKKIKKIEIYSPCKKYIKALVGFYSSYETGPFEFVNDILNAEIVVASSFHAIAFSILLEKDFIAVLNKGADTRVSDLLKYVGLENRIVSGLDDYIEKQNDMVSIDYGKVRKKLAQWREESLNELRKICMLK